MGKEFTRVKKIDVSFESDDEITQLVTQFESCTWPYKRWTHRAHIAVAASYLLRLSYEEALNLARKNIDQYNKKCGDPSGYHETMTRFFLRLVQSALNRYESSGSLSSFVNKTAEDYPLTFIFRYYSKNRLGSKQAKSGWVEPDIKKIDF